ncbi:MAG TPA: 50S ribosome-binding GTPase, partial [Candidatus Ozemobacteraceae bacterium]|nr:50S ribosome-binding GTPase [Candidatus Ozemobacteraceae bacterium]
MNPSQQMRDMLETSRRLWGRPSDADLPALEHRLQLLAEREATQTDGLLVGLVGGTNVGKSTLINALAGQEIAPTSARASYSLRPAVYVHRNREAMARTRLAGLLQPEDRFLVHAVEPLERLILVDSPDFDGINEENRDVFRQVLARLDLALCVVTTQKYDSLKLYEILGREMGYRRIAFVFNRIDEGFPFTPVIREDLLSKIAPFSLRPPQGDTLPVFAISALNYYLQRCGQTAGPAGDVPALLSLLQERLSARVVREINEEHFRLALEETRAALWKAGEWEKARRTIENMLQMAIEGLTHLYNSLKTSAVESQALLDSEYRFRHASRLASGFDGPFGGYLRLWMAFRGLLEGLPAGESSFLPACQDFLRRAEPTLLSESLLISRRLADEADRCGFLAQAQRRIPLAEKTLPPHPGDLAVFLRQQMAEQKIAWWENLALNLIPTTIILLLARYFVVCLVEVRDPAAGMFLGGFLIFWLVCQFQAIFWY